MEKPIDLIAFLSGIVEENTAHYKEDFDQDVKTLRAAALSPWATDRSLYWMSRPNGTWCVNEREAFMAGTGAHSIWTHYADDPEGIRAYRITVMPAAPGESGGKVMGAAYPLDYREQVQRVIRSAVPVEQMTIIFEGGISLTLNYEDYQQRKSQLLTQYGHTIDIAYHPHSEPDLTEIIQQEHRFEASSKRPRRPRKPPTR